MAGRAEHQVHGSKGGGYHVHFAFLVEEPSAKVALHNVVPRILPTEHTFDIHAYQGKRDLLKKLPQRLRGFRSWMPQDCRIVVLIDEDRRDCHEQKAELERIAVEAGLSTKSAPGSDDRYQVINRLAIEELEAWFFGDFEAINWAYTKIPVTHQKKSKYRNPDQITGGTSETLERLLQRRGYHTGGMPKIETARRISEHMVPIRNRSKSFQVFMQAIEQAYRSPT